MRFEEKRPIQTIKPYERNPRIISEKAVKAVAESIESFSQLQPIVVDAAGVIIAGHTRYRAAKYLNMETVDVIVADNLTPEQANAYRIADNKTAERSAWNLDILPDEIGPIEDKFDFTKFGFDRDELDKIMGKCIYARKPDPDKIPEEIPPKPITQPGDVIELGDHRLICGDSTKPETFANLMRGESADLVITDPPYGVDYQGNQKEGGKFKREKIENDAQSGEELKTFLTAAFSAMAAAAKKGAPVYIWCASINLYEFLGAIKKSGIEYKQELQWIKSIPNLSWANYHYIHEPVLYCKIPGEATFWNGGRDQRSAFIDDKLDPKSMSEKELRQAVKQFMKFIPTDVIREKMPDKSPLHPTTKPTRLYNRLIQNSSRRGEIILDAFGGSGTAVISAEMTHRRARVIELDPHYCDVITRRWEDYTGQEAKRPKR